MTCKVRIKMDETVLATRPERKPNIHDRLQLNCILGAHNVKYYRVILLKDGWVVVAANQEEGDKIMKAGKDLKKQKFEAVPPIGLKALQTLVLKKLDYILFEDEVDFKAEIYKEAPYTKHQIEDIYVMEEHNIIKVRFKSIETATRMKREGIKLLGSSIPPNQIETERHILPRQCMKCFAYTHVARECNFNTKLCSECSSTTHTWKECDENNPRKCTQCQGNHRTFSQLCKVRKEAVKEALEIKIIREEENNHSSYANIIKQSTRQTTEAVKKTMAEAVKETNKVADKNIKDIIKATVKEEMKEYQETMKRTIQGTIQGIIVEEMAFHTASIKEEIQKLKSILIMEGMDIHKRKRNEEEYELTDAQTWKKPTTGTTKRLTRRPEMPRSNQITTSNNFALLGDQPMDQPEWETSGTEGSTSDTQITSRHTQRKIKKVPKKLNEKQKQTHDFTMRETSSDEYEMDQEPEIEMVDSEQPDSKGRPSLSPLLQIERQEGEIKRQETVINSLEAEARTLQEIQAEKDQRHAEDQEEISTLMEEIKRLRETMKEREDEENRKKQAEEEEKKAQEEEAYKEEEIIRKIRTRAKQIGAFRADREVIVAFNRTLQEIGEASNTNVYALNKKEIEAHVKKKMSGEERKKYERLLRENTIQHRELAILKDQEREEEKEKKKQEEEKRNKDKQKSKWK